MIPKQTSESNDCGERIIAGAILRSAAESSILWVAVICLLLTGGCLSRPNLPSSSFALNCPPAVASFPNGPVLGLKTVAVSPLFDGKNFVYRLDEDRYEKDSYAEFMVSPQRMIAAAVQAHLRNSGLFRDVLDGGSVLKPSQWLEMQAREMYGDFRNPRTPMAVLSLNFLVYDAGPESHLLLEKLYRRQINLSASTAAAVVAGWNKGLDEIMGELTQDLKAGAQK